MSSQEILAEEVEVKKPDTSGRLGRACKESS